MTVMPTAAMTVTLGNPMATRGYPDQGYNSNPGYPQPGPGYLAAGEAAIRRRKKGPRLK